ncbi:MAG: peptidylprolyl isomerase [Actinomycetota bacterium]|nr:peptidylprolyl isomerase [Actinomycetota bacterium]
MSLLRRFLVLLPIVLLAASCSSADTLATVNGAEISRDDLVALRPSYDDPSTIDAEQMRSDLTLLIILEIVRDAAATEFGVEITEADIADRITNPPARYAAVLQPPDQFADVSADAIRAGAIQSLVRDGVVPGLLEEDAGGFDAVIVERPADVIRSCVRHISSATFEEAEAVLARLEAGEDFITVAAEVSLDQASPEGLIASSEGECLNWLTRVGPEFASLAATAPLNQPVGPVISGSAWDIIRVEDRLGPSSAEELAADVMEFLNPDYISSLYTPWFNVVVRNATIEVSPTVGRWSEAGIGIAPPGE